MKLGMHADGRIVSYGEGSGYFEVGAVRETLVGVLNYDGAGQVVWLGAEERDWFYERVAAWIGPDWSHTDRAAWEQLAEVGRREALLVRREMELKRFSQRVQEVATGRDEGSRDALTRIQEDKARMKTEILELAQEKSSGFPWLAGAHADYFALQELREAALLVAKTRPATKAADAVREAGRRRREAEYVARVNRYLVEYYESLFPWLAELKGDDVDEALLVDVDELDPDEDAARHWLTKAEYSALPTAVRFQLALDRYWSQSKTKGQVGRDYERYVGYLYEAKGYSVSYQGIVKGFDDLGRDLIATKGGAAEVIQCKRWSRDKTIHEKHIFQLYGTTVAYQLDNPTVKVSARFFTSTRLSERAHGFAEYLKVEVTESEPMAQYPCIKCNISRGAGERIYHLPLDQQYDNTHVELERGECYVSTVAEAEALGFRRAYRYHGDPE